jgi:predicted nucleic acid-binding protein
MAFVLDASIAASWFLPDEQSDITERLIMDLANAPGLVPSLFWFEIRNLFIMAQRRGRLAPGAALSATQQLRALPLTDGGPGADSIIIDIALRHGLSGYDASYIALAMVSSLPLATLDQKMAAVARGEGIAIVGPLERKP